MQETRRARLEAVIQEELSKLLLREIKDPRIPSLTITEVRVAQDGSHALVKFSPLGGRQGIPEKDVEKKMSDCLGGLKSAAPMMRRHLARVLTVRHIPSLAFQEDRGFENVLRVNELLKQISDKDPVK